MMLHIQYGYEKISSARQDMHKRIRVMPTRVKSTVRTLTAFCTSTKSYWFSSLVFPTNLQNEILNSSLKPCKCAHAYVIQSQVSARQVRLIPLLQSKCRRAVKRRFWTKPGHRTIRTKLDHILVSILNICWQHAPVSYKRISHAKRTSYVNHV